MESKKCEHLIDLKIIESASYQCDECVKTGDKWVHLRTCQNCGTTLCCDSSTNQHARKHYEGSRHQVIISAEPGEKWAYCYDDKLYLRYE